MFDTLMRTNFVSNETLIKLQDYCSGSEFYINESYGGLPADQTTVMNGITDRQIQELGLPAVPNEVLRSHRFTDMSEEIKTIASEINQMCEQIIIEKYNKKMSYMQGGDFVRYGVGQSLPYHQDWTVSEWVLKHGLPIVHLSSVFYINDEYSGGELLFSSTKLDGYKHDVISLKPKAGTVIFFDALRWHASAPVTEGFKYASTNFYTLENV
jgi:Rps23 Pro-64 3,4-dihydroxylase Tpa1-like proline 4-hydroxylase